MTETISPGPDAFLDFLLDEMRLCPIPHRVAFAAVLAERRLVSIPEYVDLKPGVGQSLSLRRIMEDVWERAGGRALEPDRISNFEDELSEIATLVDPDRYAAFNSYRGIWLLRLAARLCATGAEPDATVKAARASMYIAAGCDLSEDYVCDWRLRENWSYPEVQAEARFQKNLALSLRAIPHMLPDIVEELRRDLLG
jgi:hypothetical protein